MVSHTSNYAVVGTLASVLNIQLHMVKLEIQVQVDFLNKAKKTTWLGLGKDCGFG